MNPFPGARPDRAGEADAAFSVVGAPLETSTTFQPGTRFGPRRVRTFSESYDDYDRRTGRHFSELDVTDRGNVRAWDDPEESLEWLEGELGDVVRRGGLPLLIGGEHTVSLAGARAADPDVFVVLDAHLDLRAEYDGNPLSHACVTRRILEAGADEATILGARTGSEAEWDRAGEGDVTVVPPEEVANWQPDFEGSVYLSVDIDAADPAYAPGTGTMEPFGLEPAAMREVVRTVAPRAVGFDVVEVNDRDDGQAGALAGKLLREFVFSAADARE